jgi:3-oxoacyl-[acyl-carrier protein] reductase
MSLQGQTAIVTGGSRGIGKAICEQLAQMGANVVINYASNEKAAQETAEVCRTFGVEAVIVQADVAKEEDCERLIEEALAINGRIDILVNNAGITRDNIILRMKTEEFDEVIETNVRGTYLCIRKAARTMLKQKYGRIINISSVVGVRGNVGQVNYSASKAAIIGMTKSLAKELAAKKITVNAVAPGMIETEMSAAMTDAAKSAFLETIPQKRMGTAKEVADAVAFFAREEAAYVTGQVLCVDGGMAV